MRAKAGTIPTWRAEWNGQRTTDLAAAIKCPPGIPSVRARLAIHLATADPWTAHAGVAHELTGRRIDAALDAGLRWHGVLPDVMATLAVMGLIPEIRHGASGMDRSWMRLPRSGGDAVGAVLLAPGILLSVSHNASTLRITRRAASLPDAVAMAAVGRPLSALLTHPTIDGLGHRIAAARPERFETRFLLEGGRSVPIDARQPEGWTGPATHDDRVGKD